MCGKIDTLYNFSISICRSGTGGSPKASDCIVVGTPPEARGGGGSGADGNDDTV